MKLSESKNSVKDQRGIMYVELLAYFALFAAFLAFTYRVVNANSRAIVAIQNNAYEIIRVTKAGERWRKDVREAVKSPHVIQTALPNPAEPADTIQITALQIDKSSGSVWYAFNEGSVYRKDSRQPGHWEVVLEETAASSTMASERRWQTVVWRWELELKTTRQDALTQPIFSFLSVSRKVQSP